MSAGMGIESKRIRTWLASSAFSIQGARSGQGPVDEPPSYSASFNPFPALVIGVTGAAMSAHFQPYVFAVSLYLSMKKLSNNWTRCKFTHYGEIYSSPSPY